MKYRVSTAAVLAALAWATGAHAVSTGETAPAFSLPTAKGESVALDKLRGQVVYVDFWASWCGPCKRSFPWMNELQQKFGAKGFSVVAINVDKKRADADRFLATMPAQFTIAYDPAGTVPGAFAVKGMPSSYLIDADGKVVAIEEGFKDERKAALEERIRALVERR
jgi:thiol-disulfide isomerase/thioredoxin